MLTQGVIRTALTSSQVTSAVGLKNVVTAAGSLA
jgi:hypothetical protein